MEAEITKGAEFGQRMGQLVRRALFQPAPKARWKERANRAAAVLKSFQVRAMAELGPGAQQVEIVDGT